MALTDRLIEVFFGANTFLPMKTRNILTLIVVAGLTSFSVNEAKATIVIDQDYNFADGAVAGLNAIGSPVYSNGKVTLGAFDYLYSISPVAPGAHNFGFEMILNLPSNNGNVRYLGSVGNSGDYSSSQFGINNFVFARDDYQGTFSNSWPDVSAESAGGKLVGLALVWTDNGNGSSTGSVYLNRNFTGSVTRQVNNQSPWVNPQYITIGSWLGKGTGLSSSGVGDPSSLSVSQVRVFHFSSGGFNSSDLVQVVPEPSTYGLIGIAALGVAFAARRRKQKTA